MGIKQAHPQERRTPTSARMRLTLILKKQVTLMQCTEVPKSTISRYCKDIGSERHLMNDLMKFDTLVNRLKVHFTN